MKVKDISLETFEIALIMRDELVEKFLSYVRDEDMSDIERCLYYFDSSSAIYRISGPKDSYLKVNRKEYDKYKAYSCIRRSVEMFGRPGDKAMVNIVKSKLQTDSALPCLEMLYNSYYRNHILPLINHMAIVKEAVENFRFDKIEGDVYVFKYHIGDWVYNPENHQCYKPCTN